MSIKRKRRDSWTIKEIFVVLIAIIFYFLAVVPMLVYYGLKKLIYGSVH